MMPTILQTCLLLQFAYSLYCWWGCAQDAFELMERGFEFEEDDYWYFNAHTYWVLLSFVLVRTNF